MGEPTYNWDFNIHVNPEVWFEIVFARRKPGQSTFRIVVWNLRHPLKLERMGDGGYS